MNKLILTTLLSAGIAAQAGLITSAPLGGTTTVLTSVTGTFEIAPSVVIEGFTITGDPDVWYGDSVFGFLTNGKWEGLAWVGGDCDSGGCTATIDLGGLYSAVGGFVNYIPGASDSPVIEALAADGITVLETYNLATDAPISTFLELNAGAFRGISRGSADIGFFRFSGAYLAMHDLTLVGESSAVPEPGTMALAGVAMAGLFVWRRNRR